MFFFRWVAEAPLKDEILPAVMVFAGLDLKIVSVQPQFIITLSYSNFSLTM